MLVYRKKQSGKEDIFPSIESVPSYIMDQVNANNIKLQAERLEYELVIFFFSLFILFFFSLFLSVNLCRKRMNWK
jgi:hypothetical protein